MVYLLVTLDVERGKMKEWCDIYEKHILPPMKKHGQRLVGAWKTSVGRYDQVTDLYAFENLTEFENIREKLFNEPEIQKWLPKIYEITGQEESKILTPLGYGELN